MIPIKKYLLLALFVFTVSTTVAVALPNTAPGAIVIEGVNSRSLSPSISASPIRPGATVIQGVNTGGTVRVNHLANLEAILNIIANGAEIILLCLGLYYIVKTIRLKSRTPGKILGGLAKGLSLISAGLMVPGVINWLLLSGLSCGDVFF